MSRIIHSKAFMKSVCAVCFLTILGVDPLCATGPASPSKVPTNFEIIGKVSAEAAADIIAGIGSLGQGDIVLISKSKSAGTADFMLENAFVEKIRGAGMRLAVETPAKDTAAQVGTYRLSYQIIRLSISYPRISRKWWLGPREVERVAQADVFAQFINVATGDVVWVRESHKRYADTIDYSSLKSVEDAQYDFTRPPHSEFRMTKLFEPLVVGGIVVGLVYLFFSNQSNN